jgi:hypothetical protein
MVKDISGAVRPDGQGRGGPHGRLHIPSVRSERWILGCVSVLLALSFYTWLSSSGADIYIHTNVSGAQVKVDDKSDVSNGGTTPFRAMPFGLRQVQVMHVDYEPAVVSFQNGWFSGRNLTLNMNPLPVRLIVQTAPAAEVLFDNVPLGHADANGRFETNGIFPGAHQVLVRQPGFLDWAQRLEIHPPELRISAYLVISPERQRHIEESRQQVDGFLRTAQQQFLARQFSSALAAVTDALRLDPNNHEALTLRDRIEQTMKILK